MARRARDRASAPPRRERVAPAAVAQHLDAFRRYSSDALLLFDASGRLVGASERAAEVYGNPGGGLPSLGAGELLPSGGLAELTRRLEGAPPEGLAYEEAQRRADGSTFPAEVSVRHVAIEGSTYLQAVVRDISGRKRAEETLAYQAMLLAHMNEAVMGLDEKFVLRAWNRAAERIYGWKAEEVLGKPILRLLDTEYSRGFDRRVLARVLEDGRMRLDMRQRRKDGTLIDVEGVSVALRDEAGRITGYVAVNRDVTDRLGAEQALRLSEERLKLALGATGDGLWDVNFQTSSGYLSPAWAARLGLPAADLPDGPRALGALAPEVGSPEEARMQQHLGGGTPWYEYERRLTLAGGETRWVLVRGKVAERGVAGEPVRLIGTVSDVTEKKALQTQLIQSDRMASMGTLAAGVAHEINNPLAYVVANLGWVALALRQAASGDGGAGVDPELYPEVLGALEEARGGAERVRAIVRDLKTFSRADDSSRGVADVRRVVESALNLARNEIRHRARVYTEFGEAPLVQASEHRLGQVFLNLLINAAQAIPEGRAHENEIRAAVRTDGRGWVVAEIRDSGSGIEPEHLGRIFDPFFTTKPAGVGTGLGLAICDSIVGGLGGRIEVESRPGKGSAFRVFLPPAEVPEPSEEPPPAPRRTAPSRILVVDDEPLVAKAIQRILAADHEVTTDSSACAALARAEKGERFDVIICDLMMPEMSGMDLYQALRQSAPDQADRVVFLTGGAFTPAARAFLDRAARPLVEKPFEPETLRQAVALQLGRSRSARAAGNQEGG